MPRLGLLGRASDRREDRFLAIRLPEHVADPIGREAVTRRDLIDVGLGFGMVEIIGIYADRDTSQQNQKNEGSAHV